MEGHLRCSNVFLKYVAALSSAESITKEETLGFLAHMFSILKLAKVLGGTQWVQYGWIYRDVYGVNLTSKRLESD